MTGNEYADLIASYLVKNFSARGVTVYREVSLGKTIIGKNRHVDIFVLHAESDHALAIECKYQDSAGTVDEKIPYAIQDMQAMGMSVCLAYAGSGFSDGILHMLAGCPIAASCLPPPTLEPTRNSRARRCRRHGLQVVGPRGPKQEAVHVGFTGTRDRAHQLRRPCTEPS